jgi:hypothetical protein
MPLDFTVITPVSHHFGAEGEEAGVSAGSEFEFGFNCPNVDPSQSALLLFQSKSSTAEQELRINGEVVFGGVPPGNSGWNGNIMLVNPNLLVELGNILQVKMVSGEPFTVDNIVVLYKKIRGGGGGGV